MIDMQGTGNTSGHIPAKYQNTIRIISTISGEQLEEKSKAVFIKL